MGSESFEDMVTGLRVEPSPDNIQPVERKAGFHAFSPTATPPQIGPYFDHGESSDGVSLFMYGSWEECWKQPVFYEIGEEFDCLNVDVLRACARLWKLVIRRNAEEITSEGDVNGYFLPMPHDAIEREIRFPGLLESLDDAECEWFTVVPEGVRFNSGAPVVIRHGGGWMTNFGGKNNVQLTEIFCD